MTASELRDSDRRVDGRSERRRRGREAVVDATIALIAEHQRPPSADEVAERAGVSAATLFRYFPNLDEMRLEAIGRFAELSDHLVEVPDLGVGDRDDRVAALIAARLEMYETVAPMARFARARAAEQPMLAEVVNARRDVMTRQIADHFSAELDSHSDVERADLIDVIAALTSFEAWDMATVVGRGHDDVVRAWTSALNTLLG